MTIKYTAFLDILGFPDFRNGKKYNKLKEILRNSEVLKGIECKYRIGIFVPLHVGQKVACIHT